MEAKLLTDWILTAERLPPEGRRVRTKIDDAHGLRNEGSTLTRYRNLWFLPDGETYVYYCPTHWRGVGA